MSNPGETRPWHGGRDWPRHQAEGERPGTQDGRSDERIREDVCERLSGDDGLDGSDIAVRVAAGEVTLDGTVEEGRAKRIAEEIACSCSGVVDVHNALRVVPRANDPASDADGDGDEEPTMPGMRTQTGIGSTSGRS
jgi:hypothetical protein